MTLSLSLKMSKTIIILQLLRLMKNKMFERLVYQDNSSRKRSNDSTNLAMKTITQEKEENAPYLRTYSLSKNASTKEFPSKKIAREIRINDRLMQRIVQRRDLQISKRTIAD